MPKSAAIRTFRENKASSGELNEDGRRTAKNAEGNDGSSSGMRNGIGGVEYSSVASRRAELGNIVFVLARRLRKQQMKNLVRRVTGNKRRF